jgi:hypothetical protein
MSWNYRVMVKEYTPPFDKVPTLIFSICRVYYDKNFKPDAYEEGPSTLTFEDVKGLKWSLDKMQEATKKPIIWQGNKWPQIYKGRKPSLKKKIKKYYKKKSKVKSKLKSKIKRKK